MPGEVRSRAADHASSTITRLDVHPGSDLQARAHSEDVGVSTLRQYLEALGARLELVAVFDDEGRRVPVNLGMDSLRDARRGWGVHSTDPHAPWASARSRRVACV